MPGRPRKIGFEKYRSESPHKNTSEFVHDLLVKELGAVLVSSSDKTAPEKWAPTLEEVESMGLFDQYAREGMDLGEIRLNPFAYDDGTYEMAFAGAELLDPSQDGWDPQIEFDFIIIANSDGSPTPLKDRRYSEKMRFPVTIKQDDEDKEKAAKKAIDRIAQRMYSLGIADPVNADISDINKLKGERFITRLQTGTAKEGQRAPQFFNILAKKRSDEEATKSFFDEG